VALIRWILAKIILFLDSTFSPRPIERSPQEQARLDERTRSLVLYQYEACPFCVKVRRTMKRLNLHIELKDAKKVKAFADELVQGGGQLQVPCLRITEATGEVHWMYESSDILEYLNHQFA
jgi:glutaredoxin